MPLLDSGCLAADRARVEAALRESEDRFRSLIKQTSDIITAAMTVASVSHQVPFTSSSNCGLSRSGGSGRGGQVGEERGKSSSQRRKVARI
jgi:hypothetical protein